MSEWKDWAQDGQSWSASDEVAKQTSGGDYLSLSDGDKVQVVFFGAPYAFKSVWLGGQGGHSEIYDPKKHDGESPRGRFMFAVAYRYGDKGAYTPGLFEASATTYATVKKALQKHGAKNTFELEREGSDKKTKYHVLFDHRLEGRELEHVAGLDYPDPKESVEGTRDSAPTDLPVAEGSPFGDEDIPF